MKHIRIDAVADLESQHVALEHVRSKPGLTEPVILAAPLLVCAVRRTKEGLQCWSRDSSRLVRDLLTLEGVTWWHGGGRYDLRWLLGRCLEHGVITSLKLGRGGGIGELRVGRSVHRDSSALWGVPLEVFAQGTGQEKGDLGLACICRSDCGGYCRIRQDASPSERARIAAYCAQDCEALWAGLHRIREWQAELGLVPRWSMAATAWHSARAESNLGEPDPSRSRHEYARDALGSGRAQSLTESAGECTEVDRSGAYAAELRLPIPLGESVRLYGPAARRAWDAGREGIYQAVVRVPESSLPPLPYRSASGRISYPQAGTIIGRWARPELEHGLEQGCELVSLDSAQVYGRSEPALRGFIDRLGVHRFDGSPERRQYVKGVLASLYGALAQRPVSTSILVQPSHVKSCPCEAHQRRREDDEADRERRPSYRSGDCRCLGRCCDGCRGDCGAYQALDEASGIYLARSWRLLDRCHLGAAVYTTARARVALHRKALERDGGADVVCMDTDSITSIWPRSVGESLALGEWRKVATYSSVRIINPRAREATVKDSGKVVRRASGLHRETHKAAFGQAVRDALAWQLVSLPEALRSGSSWRQRPLKKSLQAHVDRWGQERLGDRVRDGATWRAPYVGECE